jgi:hypothetical protein
MEAGATNTTSPTVDALRLETCPSCGYLLQGLPPEGVCPECGQRYDQHEVILQGWARGLHASIANAKPTYVVLYVALMSINLINVPWMIRLGHIGLAIVCVAAWALAVGLPLWWRFTRRGPGLVEVRLSSHGCVQFDAPTQWFRPRMTPWKDVSTASLSPAGRNSYRLKIGREVFLSGKVIDAEFECSEFKAKALQQRIQKWWRVSDRVTTMLLE